ncbi:MAG TPA: folylpolyglutamate synthase/dihydrofolate synthase family protein, partial [Pyrinomonadaceae bacterium]|nr:folylpolyglutamate synthase/dihydrofolate synthase family protein [Pyrinomonadaceae bacterium]
MNFAESEGYLLSLGNEVSAMKLGLENIGKLLAAFGDPQSNCLKVQIAGTNGKGSVCAFLDAICVSAGVKTGLYTSPHLVSIAERIRISGREISEEDFARHATLIRETAERLVGDGSLETVPTFFEQVTAIALNFFAEQNVELAILETGLGGRFDATTAANAEIGGITRIDYDHQNILGATLNEIAAEKAAIIHEGSEVVVGEQEPEAMNVILARCSDFGLTPKLPQQVSMVSSNGWINFETEHHKYKIKRLGLAGGHQIENAKVAILLAETLQEYFDISPENITTGLETAVHPGRLERRGRFLFDGAHNIGGANALRRYLDENVSRPTTMIFGAMRDKDLSEIAEILFPKARTLILTRPENPRSADPQKIAGLVPQDKEINTIVTESVSDAIEKALAVSADDERICVTGS